MKIFTVIFILALASSELRGQKIEGVYVGEIISSGNVLVIGNGAAVTGWLFLNKNEKREFLGSYENKILTGKINLFNGDTILISAGKFAGGKMRLSVSHLGQSNLRNLYKVSSNSKYEIERLYSTDRDINLIGEWKSVVKDSELSEYGETVDRFEADGRYFFKFTTMPAKMQDHLPEGFDPHRTFEVNWHTNDDELVTTGGGINPITNKYFVVGDTLKIMGRTRLRIFVRK